MLVTTILIVVGVILSYVSIRYWVRSVATEVASSVAKEVATKTTSQQLDEILKEYET